MEIEKLYPRDIQELLQKANELIAVRQESIIERMKDKSAKEISISLFNDYEIITLQNFIRKIHETYMPVYRMAVSQQGNDND